MNIYVGDLCLGITDEELRREFAAFGEVTSITIMSRDYISSGRPGGYAFVEMPSLSEGLEAIAALNGKTLGQQMISVIKALPLSNHKSNSFHIHRRTDRFSVNGSPKQ